MTGENGITRQNVRQVIVSDPQLARELGAFFSAERATTLQTKSLGTFAVDGRENGVLYGRLGSRDVSERMAGNIDMVPGNVYTLEADGNIDKSWFFGGDVAPGDELGGGRSGSRLQVAVIDRDGNVVDRQNYRPGMEISTDQEGARLGFIFADGDLSDNSGHFNVNVRETSATQQTTNVGIVAADADGIDRAGRAVVDAFEAAPEAASLPEPDPTLAGPPAERGLEVDRDGDAIETTDGYRFEFADNEVVIDWPGRHEDGSAETRIRGRDVLEGDGTEWQAEDGNYVLPNGALFTLGYGEDGRINNFTLVHGDSRVDVDDIGGGDPRIGNVRDGGLDYRRRAVEDNFGGSTFRMGGTNDGWSNLDVAWNLESQGQNVGLLESDSWILSGQPYFVDPELKPQFGTADYERMLRAEIEDVRSAISGSAMAQGAERDVGRLLGDHILGSNGTYDAYAEEMQASAASRDPSAYFPQMLEQMWLEQMLGGMPQYHGNFDNAMSSVQMLQQLLASQAGMQSDYSAASNPVQTFIPNYQQQQIDPAMLVDQVLRGTGQRNIQSPGRNRLERFDIGADRRGRGTFANDPGAALLQRRIAGSNATRQDPQEVELNATRAAAEIHDAIAGPGTDEAKLTRVLSNATGAEREEIKRVYQEIYGESIEDAIKGDTSGNYESTLLGLLDSERTENNRVDDVRATQDAAALNEAIRSDWWNPGSWGTDDDKVKEIFTNRSPAELKRISEVYEQTYGESLRSAIEGDTSGDYEDALTAQLDRADQATYQLTGGSGSTSQARATQAAMAINEAVRGGGTDEDALVRTLSSLSNEDKANLKEVYQHMYGESVEDAIKGDTSGNFENTLISLLNNPRSEKRSVSEADATRLAATLHDTIAGWGTEDGRLIQLMTTSSPAELAAASRIYEEIYGESLKSAIEGDTSGSYENALTHQLTLAD